VGFLNSFTARHHQLIYSKVTDNKGPLHFELLSNATTTAVYFAFSPLCTSSTQHLSNIDILQCFDTMTLLVGRQEEHLACEKLTDEVLAWLCLEQGANDLHMVELMPLPPSLASLKSRLV